MEYINVITDGLGFTHKYIIDETEEIISIQENDYCEAFENSKEKLIYKKVNKIMPCWKIWNIGSYMGHDEYLPLFTNIENNISDKYYVDVHSLKAIKLPKDEIKVLRQAATQGCLNLNFIDAIKDKELREKTKTILQRITK